MSLTYSTLQAAILAAAHRPALTTEVIGFIRQAEGLIRRELVAFEVRGTLSETDRSSGGVYNLPSTLLEVRDFKNSNDVSLENVGPQAIRALTANSDVLQYALGGNGQVEFRGVPGTNYIIQILYYGWPAELSGASDTNIILQQHESIYIDGGLAYLYEFTQDLELADRAMNRALDAIERLNQQYGRRVGGQSMRAGYNLGNIGTSTGY
jgi:hypothetical protein